MKILFRQFLLQVLHRTEALQLEHHLTLLHSKSTPTHFLFFLRSDFRPVAHFFFAHAGNQFPSRSTETYFVRLQDPRRVSPYLSRGPDLIKIMRDELFDQDLLTTRRRLQATDKPRPRLPSSSVVLSAATLHPSFCHGSFFFC